MVKQIVAFRRGKTHHKRLFPIQQSCGAGRWSGRRTFAGHNGAVAVSETKKWLSYVHTFILRRLINSIGVNLASVLIHIDPNIFA